MSDNSPYAMLAPQTSSSTMPRKARQLRRFLVWASIVTGLSVAAAIYLTGTDAGRDMISAKDAGVVRISGAVCLTLCFMGIVGIMLVNKAHPRTKLVSLIVAVPILLSFPIGTFIGVGILISLFSDETRNYLTARPDGPETFDPRE